MAEVVRYFLLSSHYRSPLNFSDDLLGSARASLDGLYIALCKGSTQKAEAEPTGVYRAEFHKAMDDDFGTPNAFSVLHRLAGDINKAVAAQNSAQAGILARELVALGGILGLLQRDPTKFLQGHVHEAAVSLTARSKFSASGEVVYGRTTIEVLIEQRQEARRNKDWPEADRIRDELKERSVILEDDPDGTTTWRGA